MFISIEQKRLQVFEELSFFSEAYFFQWNIFLWKTAITENQTSYEIVAFKQFLGFD